MDKKALSAPVLRRHLKPLINHGHPIEAVYVYGSAVKGAGKAGDIDILVIVNDTAPLTEAAMARIDKACASIKESGKKSGLEFHFQPAKPLSRWWHSLIEGEPWIISSLKDPLVLHDRKGVVREVRGFIEKETLYNREEKAEKLLERSDFTALQNRRLLLGTITNLANAGTEAAQILLLFDGKFLLNKRSIVEELERSYVKLLGRDVIDTYREIADLEEKVNKGTLSEFSAENLDYYLERLKAFISKVEEKLGGK